MVAPGSVRHLVLISGRPGLGDDDALRARAAADDATARKIERDGVDAFLDHWLAAPMFEGLRRRPPEWRLADLALRRVNTVDGLAAAVRGYGLGAMPFLGERLGELSMPVTVMVGSEDSGYVAIANDMVGKIPAATLHVVDGAGHAVVAERPEAVASVVAAAAT